MNKLLGRLIFFLYPGNNVQLIKNIFMNEFVIYPINDPDKLIKLLKEFPSSIILINIDFNKEFNWKNYIKKIQEDKILKEVSINIISNNKKALINLSGIENLFYLDGKSNILDLIIKYLENNYAKGRRKYIRIELEKENKIEFNIKEGNKIQKGFITNINSKAGVFNFNNKSFQLNPGTKINNIEFTINGIFYILSGTVFRSIESFNENLYVIIFDMEHMKTHYTEGIQNYIYKIMQQTMANKTANI